MLFLIQYLRSPPTGPYPRYGYDLYIPTALRAYLGMNQGQGYINDDDVQRRGVGISAIFYAAAWNLCRRGIIRPGVNELGAQATADGSGGNGYSVTPFGQQWLREIDRDDFVPTEPERFGQLLSHYLRRLGKGFQERGQEAVRCYGAHAYLACCAMAGAAAESALLAIAIAKRRDEDVVLRSYVGSSGRSRVEKMILGQLHEGVRREFLGFTTLLKYWRDEASHGRASNIGDNEAYTSLAMLLRFAQFAEEHWEQLTT